VLNPAPINLEAWITILPQIKASFLQKRGT
jgi:hypothetical protein